MIKLYSRKDIFYFYSPHDLDRVKAFIICYRYFSEKCSGWLKSSSAFNAFGDHSIKNCLRSARSSHECGHLFTQQNCFALSNGD